MPVLRPSFFAIINKVIVDSRVPSFGQTSLARSDGGLEGLTGVLGRHSLVELDVYKNMAPLQHVRPLANLRHCLSPPFLSGKTRHSCSGSKCHPRA